MAKKRLVNLSECVEGDFLAQDVYTERNVLLVTENTRINRYIIGKLAEFRVDRVFVSREPSRYDEADLEESFQLFVKDYDENVDSIKAVISDLTGGKKLNYDKISEITHSLYKGIQEKNNVIRCLSTIKDFDQYTYNHCVNVSLYCMLLGKWLRFKEEDVREVMKAGLLHDIGKSQIPLNVLNKRGKLDNVEFELMKQHPLYGYAIAKKTLGLSRNILEGILMHHEREDGSGYPDQLKGEKINLFAKIVAIADVYDALTSERVYKSRITPFETFSIIERTGYGQFDTKIMMIFLHNIASYYIGAEIIVSGGKKGKVVYVVPQNISAPIIEVDHRFIDLSKEQDIKILELCN